MFLLANENGDWIRITKESKFHLLNTDSPEFKEYVRRNDTEMDNWLENDKIEYIIEEAGRTLSVASLESGRIELEDWSKIRVPHIPEGF